MVRSIAHAFANRTAESAAYVHEALRRAERARDPAATSRALLNLADLLVTEDPRAAAEAARSAITHGRRVGDRSILAVAVNNLMQALLLSGDWAAADEARAAAVESDGLGDDPVVAYGTALLRGFRGDRTGLAAVMPAIEGWTDTEDHQELAAAATALAASATCQGDHVAALRHAKRALEHAEAIGFRHDTIRWAWAMASDAALALDDQDEVSRLLEWVSANPPGHLPAVLHAEVLRIRARLLHARGEDAAAAFEAATKAFRELGSPYHLAVGLLDQAAHLAAAGHSEPVTQLAAEAGELASALGATSLTARAAALLGSGLPDATPTSR